ncbi:34131_t:CDS:2 [Gigaspora margarita]|uniref:34131_t:CDS:1 n=1 Tax=Gigaspora margarita TaxID=4874 RepID=A0ABM8W4A5_GIGMA|nr:34131_t:CDS:2 [Gigaspora margarita]
MPYQMRKQLHNYFVIGFVPFGGDIRDFIKPFLEEIKKLEHELIMNINRVDHWIICGSTHNKHNLEPTLLRQVNTLQTLQYLANSEIDNRIPNYSTPSIFIPLITTPQLCNLLSGWCINNNGLSIHCLDNISELDIEDSINITNSELFNCSEIKLELKWNRYQIETAGFISNDIRTNGLHKEIMNIYTLYYSFEQALLDTQVYFYENKMYTISKSTSDYYKVKIKVGKIVEATLFGESTQMFGKIISIIKHKHYSDSLYCSV